MVNKKPVRITRTSLAKQVGYAGINVEQQLRNKLALKMLVEESIETCDEFKRRIDYNELVNQRWKEKEKDLYPKVKKVVDDIRNNNKSLTKRLIVEISHYLVVIFRIIRIKSRI